MEPQPDSLFIASRLRVGLGTFVAVEATAANRKISELAIADAFDAVAQVERAMHPLRAGSDLFALHHHPLGTPLRVHPWTWRVLALCQRLNCLSRGRFDPCPTPTSGHFTDLELQPPDRVIPHARLHLDLGGIAKGFAVDRAIDALRAAGCHRGLVNAGGDVAVFGDREHDVLIRSTSTGPGTTVITLLDSAVATSDAGNESRPAEHRGYYSGMDRTAVISGCVSVVAPCAAVADGLTKCLLAGDDATNAALLQAFDAHRI